MVGVVSEGVRALISPRLLSGIAQGSARRKRDVQSSRTKGQQLTTAIINGVTHGRMRQGRSNAQCFLTTQVFSQFAVCACGAFNKKVYKNTACRLTYMPKWCSSVFCGGWKKLLNNGHQRQPCPERAREALERCCNPFPPAGSFEFKAGFRSSLILTGPKLTLNLVYGPPSQTQMKAGLS